MCFWINQQKDKKQYWAPGFVVMPKEVNTCEALRTEPHTEKAKGQQATVLEMLQWACRDDVDRLWQGRREGFSHQDTNSREILKKKTKHYEVVPDCMWHVFLQSIQ